MPLKAHIAELRRRVLLAFVGIAAGAVAGWFLYTPVYEFLQEPVLELAERDSALVTVNFGGLASALDMQLKVSLVLGAIIAAPWWLYQLWAFIAPGLKDREKRYTFAFLAAAVPLFFGGVAFASVVLPQAVGILVGFTPDGAANVLDAQMYLTFAVRMLLAFGIAFVFPVVMVALTWIGLVGARTWLRGWRWAMIIIALAAAVLTPTPDGVMMVLMALPMVLLYFLAVGIAALRQAAVRRRARRAGAEAGA